MPGLPGANGGITMAQITVEINGQEREEIEEKVEEALDK